MVRICLIPLIRRIACYRCYDQDEDEAIDSRILCVKQLLEAGAKVNYVKPGTGLTALHWAAFNDDKVIVNFLLNNGASILCSSSDETPLDIAGLCEHYEVANIILLHWWKQNSKNGSLLLS